VGWRVSGVSLERMVAYLKSSITTSLAVSRTASLASSKIFIMKGVNDRNEKLCCDR